MIECKCSLKNEKLSILETAAQVIRDLSGELRKLNGSGSSSHAAVSVSVSVSTAPPTPVIIPAAANDVFCCFPVPRALFVEGGQLLMCNQSFKTTFSVPTTTTTPHGSSSASTSPPAGWFYPVHLRRHVLDIYARGVLSPRGRDSKRSLWNQAMRSLQHVSDDDNQENRHAPRLVLVQDSIPGHEPPGSLVFEAWVSVVPNTHPVVFEVSRSDFHRRASFFLFGLKVLPADYDGG